MKRIRFTETDKDYLTGLLALINQSGKVVATDRQDCFEVNDDFDVNQYHGIELFSDQSFQTTHPDVVAWLKAYNGNFPFYLSLKSQYLSKGKLSDKQVDCIVRAIARDNAPVIPRSYSIEPNTVIIIGKYLAKQIAEKAGYPRAHHALEIVAVLGETEKAYKLKVKLTAQRSSHCSVCGLALTNPESVKDGIGPICAEKSELPSKDLLGLAQKLDLMRVREVETWLPKSSIKERVSPVTAIAA